MAALVFNIAKGRLAYLATLPAANDGLVALLLTAAQADASLRDHATVAAMLAGGNTEATFTGYSRKALGGVTVTVDNVGDTVTVDCTDPVWNPTAAQALVRLVIAYDDDIAAGTDTSLIPLFADDFALTTPASGTVTYVVATGGFYQAS